MTYRFTAKKNMFDGVLAYINKHYFDSFDSYISFEASGHYGTNYGTLQDILPPKQTYHVVLSEPNTDFPSCTITLKKNSINVTGYSIKRTSWSTRILSKWQIDASFN